MHNVFVVHEGKSYLHYRSVKGGEYLFSSNPKSIEDLNHLKKDIENLLQLMKLRKFIASLILR